MMMNWKFVHPIILLPNLKPLQLHGIHIGPGVRTALRADAMMTGEPLPARRAVLIGITIPTFAQRLKAHVMIMTTDLFPRITRLAPNGVTHENLLIVYFFTSLGTTMNYSKNTKFCQ
jgi:hypothetical protein